MIRIILMTMALSGCAQMPICPQVTISICPVQAVTVAK